MYCASFSDKTIEHFMQPRNVGDMPDADAVGSSGEPGCGDFLAIFIKVTDNRISDISFLVDGCVAGDVDEGDGLADGWSCADEDEVPWSQR